VSASGSYRFDRATAVTAEAAPGVWAATVDPSFSVGGRTNGGYLLAVATRAALAEAEAAGGQHLDPVAVSGAFVAVAPPGPVQIVAEVLRAGRGSTVVRAAVRSAAGAPARYLEATVTFGTLPEAADDLDPAEHLHDLVPTVDLPPEEECVRLPTQGPGFEVALMGEMSERLDPASLGWTRGQPSGVGELRGWVRFDDDRPVDPLALVLAADCLPPATFDLGLTGWVPTMHLSVWLRARPAPGPLRVRQLARVVAGGSTDSRNGTVDEVCDIWDASGSLVATGHQLAGLRLPG
jgi:hypothetical protein